MKISEYEKKNYVLGEKDNLVILSRINKLEKLKLKRGDKKVVKLIKT